MAVVIDPAHGGADSGARGTISEKDIVLAMAREIRNQLQRQGYRAVMTRDSDSDPSYDDRAALANATSGAVFISLHIGSSGPTGTVRVYYYRLATPFTLAPLAPGGAAITTPGNAVPPQTTLTPWRDAQRPFNASSQNLANLLQTALSAQFSGSPANASAAAVRELRSVAGPAIAIEISNISVSNPGKLGGMVPQLASAIGQSIASFKNSTGSAAAPGATPGAPH